MHACRRQTIVEWNGDFGGVCERTSFASESDWRVCKVSFEMSLSTCLMFLLTCLMSLLTCLMSLLTCVLSRANLTGPPARCFSKCFVSLLTCCMSLLTSFMSHTPTRTYTHSDRPHSSSCFRKAHTSVDHNTHI